jgi:hypothetical protein
MFLVKSKLQDYLSSFPAIEFSPVINTAMGTGVGPGINGIGTEIEQYSQLIGKPLTSKGDNLAGDKDQEGKRKRAKRANEIFRIISKSVGLHFFFFDKFLVWSDYVEGKLNEEEFVEKVREEVKRKAESLKN